MSETVLVTGATGFVGGHVVEHLVKQGTRVVATDIRAPSERIAGVEWTVGDLADPAFVDTLPKHCHGVVHAAGVSRAGAASRQPIDCIRGTTLATTLLLNAVGKGLRWCLLLSSRMVTHLEERTGALGGLEDIYAVSKQATESIVRCFAGQYRFRAMALRLSDVYGSPKDHPDKLLPTFVRLAQAGKPLTVKEPNAEFFFVHVDDLLRAFDAAVASLRAEGPFEIRDAWSRPGVGITELGELVIRLCHSASEIVESPAAPSPPPVTPNTGWTMSHRVSLEEGIRRLLHSGH